MFQLFLTFFPFLFHACHVLAYVHVTYNSFDRPSFTGNEMFFTCKVLFSTYGFYKALLLASLWYALSSAKIMLISHPSIHPSINPSVNPPSKSENYVEPVYDQLTVCEEISHKMTNVVYFPYLALKLTFSESNKCHLHLTNDKVMWNWES